MRSIGKLLLGWLAAISVPCFAQSTFTNPIIDGNSADPSAIRLGDFYYLTLSEKRETELTIYKSAKLTSFRDVPSTVAYRTTGDFSDLWASEMHALDGQLYIYFTMRTRDVNHRMYVIKADDPSNPMGNWSSPIRLMADWDFDAIDGTIFNHGNGMRYFVWASGKEKGLSLWIAPMSDPFTISPTKIHLRWATHPWEMKDGAVNEGAYFIYRNGVSYMVFSASSTWSPDYCLSMMSINDNQDPMDVNQWTWWYGPNGPVFWRNDAESVYTTGHAMFTLSPDGTETWMVYHGTVSSSQINGFRTARIEKIGWDNNGVPVFPRPSGYNHSQSSPSGQDLTSGLSQTSPEFSLLVLLCAFGIMSRLEF